MECAFDSLSAFWAHSSTLASMILFAAKFQRRAAFWPLTRAVACFDTTLKYHWWKTSDNSSIKPIAMTRDANLLSKNGLFKVFNRVSKKASSSNDILRVADLSDKNSDIPPISRWRFDSRNEMVCSWSAAINGVFAWIWYLVVWSPTVSWPGGFVTWIGNFCLILFV